MSLNFESHFVFYKKKKSFTTEDMMVQLHHKTADIPADELAGSDDKGWH